MTTHSTLDATIVGYPRIGPHRELKRAVEAYWAGRSTRSELEESTSALRASTRERLVALGLAADEAIPGSFSYYDQVLDAAVAVDALPHRFDDVLAEHRSAEGGVDLDGYFALARGTAEQPALEMTKWFDSNYHYIVPEIERTRPFRLNAAALLARLAESQRADSPAERPTLVGPLTLLLLSKPADESPENAAFDPLDRLDELTSVYAELLRAASAAGATWFQLDEPGLVADQRIAPAELARLVERTYRTLSAVPDRPRLLVTTPYGELGELFAPLASSGIEALHIDLVRGAIPDAAALAALGTTRLVAGVVDGHNIWRTDLAAATARLEVLASRLPESAAPLGVSTSTSLLHVPHTVSDEPHLPAALKAELAFADEKVGEVVALAASARSIAPGTPTSASDPERLTTDRSGIAGVIDDAVRRRTAALGEPDRHRSPYAARAAAQTDRFHLPLLPTTTIGSFPQTREVRSRRAAARKGQITPAQYEEFLHDEITRVIRLQERLGLDVLVHGEPERNDMVQYFAEHLDGFATTENGWVQSYGSRCTRPSILWGDVSRPAPITVPWSTYAEAQTDKPVKGMLTGPVTILAWSFVRDDQPLGTTADQVALALRDEITDLEDAGIGIVQVDEPALRELLPLRHTDQPAYLDWSVGAFRLATSGARDNTQVHTHLCYSEFGEVLGAINALDADVTSIESARSRMEILAPIDEVGYERGIGPGVWDIHSPRVPDVAEIADLLRRAAGHVDRTALWVNPDCGLKTRGYAETEATLAHLVEAAAIVRAEVAADQESQPAAV